MKGRSGDGRLENRMSRAKSRQADRSHLIVDFDAPPAAGMVKELEARGMRVVAYLPETAVIVGVDGAPDFSGLPVTGFDALQPEDKLSPELFRGERRGQARVEYFVVEFHGDVDWESRRMLAAGAGLAVKDHADLVGDQLLVRGTLAQAGALAEWDEVAYVFPASGELAAGLPLIGCLGEMSSSGQVGQMTQRVGEGWDGPGLGRAELNYSLQALTRKVPVELAEQEIRRAMAEWSRVVNVTFQRSQNFSSARSINILFGAKDHGDPYSFDGAGRVLAHTFYPAPANPEPIAGDLHFDDDESWKTGTDIDLYSVALHELGHALGLGHSDVPNAVMYPYYRMATSLTEEDIAAIRMMYGAAEDGPATQPPLLLTLTTPGARLTTSGATVGASGRVTGAVGTPLIQWEDGVSETGAATLAADGPGAFLWTASDIPLRLGGNEILVTARDSLDRTMRISFAVDRVEPPPGPFPVPPPIPGNPPPVPGSPPPEPGSPPPEPPAPPAAELFLRIESPASGTTVSQNPITASGAISGGEGWPSVRWTSDRGFTGTAMVTAIPGGGYRWEIQPLSLLAGANLLTVTATDTSGATATGSVGIHFRAPETPEPGADSKPPQITILSPNTTFLMTPLYSLAVRGTATDTSGIAEVRWECSCGTSGVAQGTSKWTVPSIAIPAGAQTIRIFAKDLAGNESMVRFTVFRY